MKNDLNTYERIRSLLNADTDDFMKLAEIAGLDIHKDFSGADLKNVNLTNAELRNADLSFADLSSANLENANLENANLRGVNFTKANLTGVNFNNADLRDAIFDQAVIRNSVLSKVLSDDSLIDNGQEQIEQRSRAAGIKPAQRNDNTNNMIGTEKVYYAIKSRHPELTDEQVSQMVEVVLDQVTKRIGSSDALAFFHLDEKDQAEIITYSLEVDKKKNE